MVCDCTHTVSERWSSLSHYGFRGSNYGLCELVLKLTIENISNVSIHLGPNYSEHTSS